ncbi:hypothetical protein [Streptomyces sp. NPDC001774]
MPAVQFRPAPDAGDIAAGGKAFLEAGRGFGGLESVLGLRPVFRRPGHCIRGCVLLCWLVLLLIRVAGRRTGQAWNRTVAEVGRVREAALAGGAGQLVQAAPPAAGQAALCRGCGIRPPSRTTTAAGPA